MLHLNSAYFQYLYLGEEDSWVEDIVPASSLVMIPHPLHQLHLLLGQHPQRYLLWQGWGYLGSSVYGLALCHLRDVSIHSLVLVVAADHAQVFVFRKMSSPYWDQYVLQLVQKLGADFGEAKNRSWSAGALQAETGEWSSEAEAKSTNFACEDDAGPEEP